MGFILLGIIEVVGIIWLAGILLALRDWHRGDWVTSGGSRSGLEWTGPDQPVRGPLPLPLAASADGRSSLEAVDFDPPTLNAPPFPLWKKLLVFPLGVIIAPVAIIVVIVILIVLLAPFAVAFLGFSLYERLKYKLLLGVPVPGRGLPDGFDLQFDGDPFEPDSSEPN